MKDIGNLAAKAFSEARAKALSSGLPVVESNIDGEVYETFPDGSKRFIKQIKHYIKVKKGTKIKL